MQPEKSLGQPPKEISPRVMHFLADMPAAKAGYSGTGSWSTISGSGADAVFTVALVSIALDVLDNFFSHIALSKQLRRLEASR